MKNKLKKKFFIILFLNLIIFCCNIFLSIALLDSYISIFNFRTRKIEIDYEFLFEDLARANVSLSRAQNEYLKRLITSGIKKKHYFIFNKSKGSAFVNEATEVFGPSKNILFIDSNSDLKRFQIWSTGNKLFRNSDYFILFRNEIISSKIVVSIEKTRRATILPSVVNAYNKRFFNHD